MSNCYEHFDYTDDNTGLSYRVEKHYDNNTSPLDMDECIVTDDLRWNPSDPDELEDFIEEYEPDLHEVARYTRMKPLSYGRGRLHRFYDTMATEDALIKQGVAQADVAGIAQKLYDWYDGWLRGEWHYVTLWVLPLDEHGETIADQSQCLGGIESTEEDWNSYIKDLIHDVFWSQRSAAHKGQLELNFN